MNPGVHHRSSGSCNSSTEGKDVRETFLYEGRPSTIPIMETLVLMFLIRC